MSNATEASRFSIGADLTVHRLGFGAMQLAGKGVWGPPKDPVAAITILRRAIELGVNLIDTADAYGPHLNEQLICEALHPYPDGLVIATKGGFVRPGPGEWVPVGRPAYLRQCVELSLRRLRLERIDLYQLHRIDPDVPLEDQIGVLDELRRAGKIRHIGLSEVSVDQLAAARQVAPIATVQNLYNVGNRQSEAVLEACEADGVGFIPWFPLGTGRVLRDETVRGVAERLAATPAQVALAWLLQRSRVVLPIPGTANVAHLEENMAARGVTLTPDDVAELDGLG